MPIAKKASHDNKARLNFRLPGEIKERVARAAAISGQEVTDFAVSTLSERADEVIERHTRLVLNSADHDFFLHALDDSSSKGSNSSAASERSRAAAKRYREGRRKGVKYHWSSSR